MFAMASKSAVITQELLLFANSNSKSFFLILVLRYLQHSRAVLFVFH